MKSTNKTMKVVANRMYNIKGKDGQMYFHPEDGEFEIDENSDAIIEGGVIPVDQVAFLERQIEKETQRLEDVKAAKAEEAMIAAEKQKADEKAAKDEEDKKAEKDKSGKK